MNNNQKLVTVKVLHTAVWAFFNAVLIYLFYAVLTQQVGTLFWVGVGFIILECTVLVINKWTCPLTPIARRFSDSQKHNFDIYLPEWLAEHNKTIYTILVVILIILYFIFK